jgi:hypothetical protein
MRPLASLAIVALFTGLFASGPVLAADGTVYAAAAATPMLESAAAVSRPAAQTVAAPTKGDADIQPAYGADPDPANFDRAGLEHWWAKYQAAHPSP